MGGVLVDLDIEGCKSAFKSFLGFHAIDEIIDPCHQKGIYGQLEEGVISGDDFRRMVLAESLPGSIPGDVDRAMYHILIGIDSYKADLLRKLSESYDLYLLSNNNSICIVRAAEIFREAGIPLDEIFIKCFLSYEMKCLKPSGHFYKEVMNQIGVPASEMLFVDDSQKNVDGAIAAGLPAVHYEPGSDLSALLADVLKDSSIKMEGIS